MKNKKYHTVRTIPKSNIKIANRQTRYQHKYMTADIPGLVLALK